MDFDSFIGFWIGEVPYVWVNNTDYKECKRFYLFNPQADFSLFGENNEVTNRDYILNKRIKINNNETFCLLPLGTNEPRFKKSPTSYILKEIPEFKCEPFIRNYFLCDILLNKYLSSLEEITRKYGKNVQVRSKGKIISSANLHEYNSYFKLLYFNKFYIINDEFHYDKEYYVYPVQYTKNFDINASSVVAASYVPIVYYKNSEKREYNNFFELFSTYMTKDEKKKVHSEAMLYIYDKLLEEYQKVTKKNDIFQKKRLKDDLQVLDDFLSKIGNLEKQLPIKDGEWRYELKDYTMRDGHGLSLNGNILLAQFNYESSVKMRKIYKVRPSGNYFVKPRMKLKFDKKKSISIHPEDINFSAFRKY